MSKLRNKIPSRCYRCGEMCAEGEGHVELVTSVHYDKWGEDAKLKKWLVQHTDCAIAYRGTRTHYIYNPAVECVEPTGETDDEEPMSGAELSTILHSLVLS